ncbi:hypothetical protein I0C86_09170 [Plantactinospora sp. S1510]|uniref:Uncharacterized protein n=1 Tax=Plantactinospora alkalitolerans TaxID=2789879 RepID=A0ABS0GTB6_9ACTN|nr:CRISPR-associated protein Csx19 [Plantactinospora alkalitolerans]MBF9129147.1 hypothetical protein [Plantactinospora alkalitolerans]
MTTNQDGAVLHAVRATNLITAADAVAWFAPGTAPGRQVIGYTFSARAAAWLRVRSDGTAETVPDTVDVLSEAYEMVLFDGERELRWLRAPDGLGPAIAVGEDPARLPLGDAVTANPPPRRGDAHQTRLLEGDPAPHEVAGWTTLRSTRYASVHLPVTSVAGTALTVETIEYLAEDEHGNLDIVDTRTLGLRAIPMAQVQVRTAGSTTGRERTAA